MDETIAQRIRALREARGWSKQELARRIGGRNPRTVVQRWEAGDVIPSPASVQRLAEVFAVPVAEVDPAGRAYNLTGPRSRSRVDKKVREGVQSRAGSADELVVTPALEELLSMMRNIPDQGPLMILGGALQSVPPERRLDFALHCANQARAFAAGRPATGTDPNR